jgi:hypothetical protein
LKNYQITGPGGEIIALLSCDGLLFSLDHENEHVIPSGGVQAVRIILGNGFQLEETEEKDHEST